MHFYAYLLKFVTWLPVSSVTCDVIWWRIYCAFSTFLLNRPWLVVFFVSVQDFISCMFLIFRTVRLYVTFYSIIYVTSRRQNPITYAYRAGLTDIHFPAFEDRWFYQTWVGFSIHLSTKDIQYSGNLFSFVEYWAVRKVKKVIKPLVSTVGAFRPSNIHKNPKHNTNVYDKQSKTQCG